MLLLSEYKEKFGSDFNDNKKIVDEVSIVRSKGLRNEIAGYITKYLKRELLDISIKEGKSTDNKQIEDALNETTDTKSSEETTSTEKPVEENVDTPIQSESK